MTKDRKQSVSRFTEEQLTPLEQKFADAKANRDAEVEPYKIVPVELWDEIREQLAIAAAICHRNGFFETAKCYHETLKKTSNL